MEKCNARFLLVVSVLFAAMLFAQGSEVNKKVIVLANKINASYVEQFGQETGHRVAITEFSNVGSRAEEKHIGYLVSEILSGELGKGKHFILVERMQMEKVLEEQKLALTGILDSEKSVEVGNLLGAQAIISGSVIEAGNFFIVNARMVDVEKGQVILTESVEIPQDDLIALSNKLIVTKKYALSAGYRSLLMPGWGQFYNETPTRGYVYLSATAVSLGMALVFNMAGEKEYQNYQKNTLESVKNFDTAEEYYQYRDYALYAAAGIWVINIIDAMITAGSQIDGNRPQSPTKLSLGLTPDATGFQLQFRHSF